jgi:hypothetical protein
VGPLSEDRSQDSGFAINPREAGLTHYRDDMNEIVPIQPDHIGSFHRTFDFVARERRYPALPFER